MSNIIFFKWKLLVKKIIQVCLSLFSAFIIIGILKKFKWSIGISFYYLPSLSELLNKFIFSFSSIRFYNDILFSVGRVYGGFLIAFIVALPLAILITEYKVANYIIFPLIEFIRPIPNAAWVPISILLFNSLDGSVIFITFIGSFFPILINSIGGLSTVNSNYLRIAKSFNISRISCIFKVKLPAAGHSIFTGALLGMSGSWLGVVVAEMMNGEAGIGYVTWVNYTLVDMSGVIVCMFTIGFLGALSSLIIRKINDFMHWDGKNND